MYKTLQPIACSSTIAPG